MVQIKADPSSDLESSSDLAGCKALDFRRWKVVKSLHKAVKKRCLTLQRETGSGLHFIDSKSTLLKVFSPQLLYPHRQDSKKNLHLLGGSASLRELDSNPIKLLNLLARPRWRWISPERLRVSNLRPIRPHSNAGQA